MVDGTRGPWGATDGSKPVGSGRVFMQIPGIIRTLVLSPRRLLPVLALLSLRAHTLYSDVVLIPPLHGCSALMSLQCVLFSHYSRTDITSSQHNRSRLSFRPISTLSQVHFKFSLSGNPLLCAWMVHHSESKSKRSRPRTNPVSRITCLVASSVPPM
jgi:hypothetical protein